MPQGKDLEKEMNFQSLVLELLEEAFKAEKEQGLHGWFSRNKGK